MRPTKSLPYSDLFGSDDEFVESLLDFTYTSKTLQMFCGGVHILDFFVNEEGLFRLLLPPDWQKFLLEADSMALVDFLLRDDLDSPKATEQGSVPPQSLLDYVRAVRKHTLNRDFTPRNAHLPAIDRRATLGMKPKKAHEVAHFADFCNRLADSMSEESERKITHLVDFGSGQNYLGRTLASPPYNRSIVAVESKEHNIAAAQFLDMMAGVAEKEKVMRNKKLVDRIKQNPEEAINLGDVDLRPLKELKVIYRPEAGKGFIRYVEGRVNSGDLSEIVDKLKKDEGITGENKSLDLMAISIHSCGNLSHHGIRSLVMNPDMKAVAIVGCCYNLLTEKLGPPSYKPPFVRTPLQAKNRDVVPEAERSDPHGFPMSERVSTYGGTGIRQNITARMMACQAPLNWTAEDSHGFFTRHHYRAILQKIFYDRGAISKVIHTANGPASPDDVEETPFNMSTNPIVIGSLRKNCYTSLSAYVRGAIKKLTTNTDYDKYKKVIVDKVADITDDEIARYEAEYAPRRKEVSSMWTLMAFSAGVVESLIVTDRWLFLKEHPDLVKSCWVETVFDHRESPRNFVVVGIKR